MAPKEQMAKAKNNILPYQSGEKRRSHSIMSHIDPFCFAAVAFVGIWFGTSIVASVFLGGESNADNRIEFLVMVGELGIPLLVAVMVYRSRMNRARALDCERRAGSEHEG